MAEPLPALPANPFKRYLPATRPAGGPLHAGLAALTVLPALLTHAMVNLLNDYYGALNGTDAANTERVFPFTDGSRFIQNGGPLGWGYSASPLTLNSRRLGGLAVTVCFVLLAVGADYVRQGDFSGWPVRADGSLPCW